MEQNYVDLKTIVNELMANPPKLPPHYYDTQAPIVWVYDCRCPPNAQSIPVQPIITEDIDCEIIQPKQLPDAQ